ncbi:hypothetical protein [Glycomyces niveus]|uniref:Uncharacterized protein n=1 Tax=Glycomyces niveus TaxID=2820287 RepID=A0ABS3U6A5_9ACTN|nr:hypothetical protein [Glycomyces sp. NEAU-S30]MBO3734317.1 hypothetical protein [Glycomyces sp. NEAU-S30]
MTDDGPGEAHACVGFGSPKVGAEGNVVGAGAAQTRLHPEDLTVEKRRQWLTVGEDTALAPKERLIRILLRSIGFGAAAPGPGGDPEGTVKAVARAYAVNDRGTMHGVTVDGLDAGAVRQFLRRLWELGDASEEACTAAARDRGFRSFDGAVDLRQPRLGDQPRNR